MALVNYHVQIGLVCGKHALLGVCGAPAANLQLVLSSCVREATIHFLPPKIVTTSTPTKAANSAM